MTAHIILIALIIYLYLFAIIIYLYLGIVNKQKQIDMYKLKLKKIAEVSKQIDNKILQELNKIKEEK
jgi:hypothetical protein